MNREEQVEVSRKRIQISNAYSLSFSPFLLQVCVCMCGYLYDGCMYKCLYT